MGSLFCWNKHATGSPESHVRDDTQKNEPSTGETSITWYMTWKMLRSQLDHSGASLEEKIAFFQTMIDIVESDLQASYAASLLYGKVEHEFSTLFPIYTEQIPSTRGKIPLAGKTVILLPHREDSLVWATLHIFRDGFRPKLSLIEGTYIPELELAIVCNGRHHTLAALYIRDEIKKVTMDADVCHLSDIFPVLDVSGDKDRWLRPGREPTRVVDQRFVILYDLAREKARLEGTLS